MPPSACTAARLRDPTKCPAGRRRWHHVPGPSGRTRVRIADDLVEFHSGTRLLIGQTPLRHPTQPPHRPRVISGAFRDLGCDIAGHRTVINIDGHNCLLRIRRWVRSARPAELPHHCRNGCRRNGETAKTRPRHPSGIGMRTCPACGYEASAEMSSSPGPPVRLVGNCHYPGCHLPGSIGNCRRSMLIDGNLGGETFFSRKSAKKPAREVDTPWPRVRAP